MQGLMLEDMREPLAFRQLLMHSLHAAYGIYLYATFPSASQFFIISNFIAGSAICD
jgi:hypothetical protein